MMAKKSEESDEAKRDRCELCGRDKRLTKHHLIPRGVHRKKRFVNRFGKKEMHRRSLMLCKECHSGIHDLIPDEKELAEKTAQRSCSWETRRFENILLGLESRNEGAAKDRKKDEPPRPRSNAERKVGYSLRDSAFSAVCFGGASDVSYMTNPRQAIKMTRTANHMVSSPIGNTTAAIAQTREPKSGSACLSRCDGRSPHALGSAATSRSPLVYSQRTNRLFDATITRLSAGSRIRTAECAEERREGKPLDEGMGRRLGILCEFQRSLRFAFYACQRKLCSLRRLAEGGSPLHEKIPSRRRCSRPCFSAAHAARLLWVLRICAARALLSWPSHELLAPSHTALGPQRLRQL